MGIFVGLLYFLEAIIGSKSNSDRIRINLEFAVLSEDCTQATLIN